jgi:response regulator of citrate/malate metabolism
MKKQKQKRDCEQYNLGITREILKSVIRRSSANAHQITADLSAAGIDVMTSNVRSRLHQLTQEGRLISHGKHGCQHCGCATTFYSATKLGREFAEKPA